MWSWIIGSNEREMRLALMMDINWLTSTNHRIITLEVATKDLAFSLPGWARLKTTWFFWYKADSWAYNDFHFSWKKETNGGSRSDWSWPATSLLTEGSDSAQAILKCFKNWSPRWVVLTICPQSSTLPFRQRKYRLRAHPNSSNLFLLAVDRSWPDQRC